ARASPAQVGFGGRQGGARLRRATTVGRGAQPPSELLYPMECIEARNSLLDLVSLSLSSSNSMPSTGLSCDSALRRSQTFCSSSFSSSSSSLRVPDCSMLMVGKMRLSMRRRSRWTSMLPVPLNSSKITSSIRLPVSTMAVAMMVSEPPSSMLRAAAKKRRGRCSALASRPPESTLPDDGMTALWARAKRVSESSRMTTSRLCSTSRLAFSITMSATWMWRFGVVRQAQPLQRIERREVVEEDLLARLLGRLEVDRLDLEEREVSLGVLGRTDLAGDGIAGAQVEAPDLGGRHVDVVRARQVVVVGGAQEPEAVRQHLQHALGVDEPVLLGLRLEDLEDQLLLAQPAHALDVELAGDGVEVGDRLFLEFGQVHAVHGVLRLVRLGRVRLTSLLLAGASRRDRWE